MTPADIRSTHSNGPRRFWLAAALSATVAAIVSACKSAPGTVREADGQPSSPVTGPLSGSQGSARVSAAATARAYRQDGATHLYGLNESRVYKGRMPPLLYAIGVMNIELDRAGRVQRLDWMRAPRHAPEVMAEIERTIRAASPFPAPAKLGRVVYTDTWLWDKSGKFQLDTLTEGQD
jgi:periplasmic protein TonB